MRSCFRELASRPRLAFLAAFWVLSPVIAGAQEQTSEPARFRWRGLEVTPGFRVGDLGIDTNIFNETENPKRDFTVSVGPRFGGKLRLGASEMTSTSAVDFVYFRHYASERAANVDTQIRLEVPLNRVKLNVSSAFKNARERVSTEIDVRARRLDHAVGLGSDVYLSPNMTARAGFRRSRRSFGGNEMFLGTNLATALNGDTNTVGLSLRHAATPLTTVAIAAEFQQDQFDVSTYRNAHSFRLEPRFEFDPSALIRGRASVGYRKFDIMPGAIPDSSGIVASADLAYILRGTTRFSTEIQRDFVYSFETETPYYLSTAVSGSVTQRITDRVGVSMQVWRELMDYRRLKTATSAPEASALVRRSDTSTRIGLGMFYRLEPTLVFRIDGDYRRAARLGRNYEGLRIVSSVTYGS